MDSVCEECGDAGFRALLLRCSKCKNAARHRYCLDTVIFDLVVEWSCSGCILKHNEAIKSLEDVSNQRQLSSIQSGCSMINGPTMDKEKITKSWGLRSIRSRRKRKDCVGGSTKQFPSGDTSNLGQGRNEPHKERKDSSDAITAQICSGDALDSCEVFVGDIPENNDYEKEGEDRNGHLTCAVECFDSSSNLPLDHASEFEPNNLQKAMDGSKLASNFTECTDLSNASSCFASSKYVEGLVPRGRKGDMFSLTNDVEGSLPMIVDKSRPTSASMEQADLSTNREKSEPLKALTGLEKSAAASKFAPNHSKPIQRLDLKTGSADVSSRPKQRLDSWSLVPMQSSPSNELEDMAVQENSAERMIMDKSYPTSASMEQASLSIKREKSEPVKAFTGLKKSDVASKFAPNHSNPIQGSDLKTGSADVLNPPKQSLDSWSMVPMQSSPSNELEDAAVQENSAERTRCLVDEETNAPTIGNLNISKPSMENECMPSNEGNSDKANKKSDEVLLSTEAKKMPMRVSADREIVNSYKVTGISNPESAKGDRRNLKRNARKPSSLGVKKALLGSRFFGPCESTKIHPRKCKQSGSYTPDGTRHQKATKIKIVNDAQLKGGRPAPAASVRDGQNMSREGNGSNDKVIGRSKKRKYKTMDLLLSANNASRESRKRRGMVTSVLEPSSLHGSSVDKSRPCSENMYLPLKESICPLNHRCSKNHKEVKKNRSMDANKDVNASVRNLDAGCAESDVSQLALETVVKEISRMPPTQPLDNPYWTGIMKIDENYIPLAAHLSTKAGKKVQEQSRSLPPIIKVTELSTSKTCPKHLEAPMPSADSIGLYFFSSDMRPNNELDQLVKHVADSGVFLEAIVGLSKLFLFPSFVLPDGYQRFQGKPFLWGVFKPREEKIKRLTPVEQNCAEHITKEDHVQEQHVLDQQDEAQGGTLDQVVHSENHTVLDDQGRPCSNPEALPPKLCGIVVSRTPRSAQLIQELQKEGALLFAVQPVMTEPGSVV
ncbi:unnamed protein product [Alopecurus aequalis]